MAVGKVERLVNLVIALLATRQFLTAEKIRATVAGYGDSVSDDAFIRMFERDKAELRELGVPLETGRLSRYSTVEGYRINRAAYALPDVALDADEAAAVAVAAQLWQSPELQAATQRALLKLRAGGVQVEAEPPVTAVPARGRGSDAVLSRLLAAVEDGRAVRFGYRPTPADPFQEREVEPWGVVTWRGRWYLVGHDRVREATRTFRLSRLREDVTAVGPRNAVRPPAGTDLRAILARTVSVPEREASAVARVWLAPGRAHELRRIAAATAPGSPVPLAPPRPMAVGGVDGTVVEVAVRSWEWIARLVAGHGPDAVALGPRELVEQVVDLLRGAAGTGGAHGPGGWRVAG